MCCAGGVGPGSGRAQPCRGPARSALQTCLFQVEQGAPSRTFAAAPCGVVLEGRFEGNLSAEAGRDRAVLRHGQLDEAVSALLVEAGDVEDVPGVDVGIGSRRAVSADSREFDPVIEDVQSPLPKDLDDVVGGAGT